jgi:hypothetical protein
MYEAEASPYTSHLFDVLLAVVSLPDAHSGLKMLLWPPADTVLLWFVKAVY